MIVAFFATFLINSIRVIMDVVGVPVVDSLPFGSDVAVSYSFSLAYGVANSFWPAQALLLALFAFITYKVLMVWLQAFFGHRVSHG